MLFRCDPSLEHMLYESHCPERCSCWYFDEAINNYTLLEMGDCHLNLNPVYIKTTTTTTSTTTTTTTTTPTTTAGGGGGHTGLVLSITLPILGLLLLLLLIGFLLWRKGGIHHLIDLQQSHQLARWSLPFLCHDLVVIK